MRNRLFRRNPQHSLSDHALDLIFKQSNDIRNDGNRAAHTFTSEDMSEAIGRMEESDNKRALKCILSCLCNKKIYVRN